MAATATTKIQISYSEKGTMINVYADTPTELDVLLHAVQDNAGLISATAATLGNASNVSYAVAQLATPQAAPAPATSTPDGHCQHGKLVWRESKPGAPKEWKGWFCPSPKGTPDQCQPKFVR